MMSHVDETELVAAIAAAAGRSALGLRVRRIEPVDDDVRISGLLWGEAPVRLVLLHGGGLNAHTWDAVLLDPALHGVPALAIDLPGHGHSDWFDEPLYVAQSIAPVLAPILADSQIVAAPSVLVGHSLGGLTALRLASGNPALVDQLVIVDATPGSTPDRSGELVAFAMAGDFASIDEAVERAAAYKPHREPESLRRSLLLNIRQDDDGRWHWRHDVRPGLRQDRWEHTFRKMPELWEDAARLSRPMLLIRGGRSPIVLDADVEQYRKLVNDFSILVVPDAGHNVHRNAPEVIAAALAEMLHSRG
jgi:pimeloyl-ACP methyl ester carboxylesterase